MTRDIRYALRVLRARPAFSAVAILTLALGIGANTAIFTVVNAVLLRALPFHDPDRLVLLLERTARFPTVTTSWQNYVDWRDQSRSFDAVGALRSVTMTMTGGAEPERVPAKMITAPRCRFSACRRRSAATSRPTRTVQDRAGVALLSDALWRRRFGAAPDIIGRAMTLDNQPYTIVGVLPPRFQLLAAADVLLPMGPWAATLPDDRGWHPGIFPLARLKAGITLRQAQAEMDLISDRLAKQYPEFDQGVSRRGEAAARLRRAERPAVAGAACRRGGIRAADRVRERREPAARARGRPSEGDRHPHRDRRQPRADRAAAAGGKRSARTRRRRRRTAAGVLDRPAARRARRSQRAGRVGNRHRSRRRWSSRSRCRSRPVCSSALRPPSRRARVDVAAAINDGGRGAAAGAAHHRLRGLLVVSEMALATMLLVGAGLLTRSLLHLQETSTGFQSEGLLVADAPLSPGAYDTTAKRNAFVERLLDRLRTTPGVEAAAIATAPPFSGGGSTIHFNITGRPPKGPEEYILTGLRAVTSDYFTALGVPLVAGRGFTDRDRDQSLPVAIVNETFAKRYFGNQARQALGARAQLGDGAGRRVAADGNRRHRRRHEAGVRGRRRSRRCTCRICSRRSTCSPACTGTCRSSSRHPGTRRRWPAACGGRPRRRSRSAAGARANDGRRDGGIGDATAAANHCCWRCCRRSR